MDGFTKRILKIPIEKPFDEAYFTHRLWMFFRETKVTQVDIRRMFHQVREKMRHMITLSKKSDPGKFAIPCVVKGVEFPHSMCDTGASVTILPRIMADHLEYESEYETEYSESIDTHTFPSIDSNESTVTDDRNNKSLDVDQPVDHFALPNHCYPQGREDDERFETHKFTNAFRTSFDEVHSTSVDTHPRPAKQPFTSMDTHTGTSIDIRAAAKIQEQENIPSPTRFIDTYLKRFAPLKPPPHTRADTQAEKMNTLPSTSTGKSMKSNHLKNTCSAEIIMPSIDAFVSTSINTTLKPNLSISKLNDNANIDYGFLTPDEFDILQVANEPDNLFSQQRGTPDVIQTDPNKHVGVATKEINPDLSCQSKGQASIDGTTQTSIDRITPTSTDKDDPTSIDRRYEFGYRAFDMYGARKFTWERRDEYGVYRDECGHARGVSEHATSFTLTRLAPELYTKDEINEMVTGICGAQEKLGEELKSLVEDTHQPLYRGYNELFRSMVEMRIEIESLRQQLEKEATTSASIDAPHAPSIDVSLPTARSLQNRKVQQNTRMNGKSHTSTRG
ncbi:hypothetical protein DY000_02013407 [Brassica cretica]|uniref:Peptidase A2 domain-containing protein n=1 Tax=Brassica cretica TaxID=69181 RepID=A0ABQ7D947_BRACR|nr:hypothetical protein DY000_02013407 [Brassica cretica]